MPAPRNPSLFRAAIIALSLCALSLRAQAQGEARVPLGADLLLQGRATEGLLVLHSGYRNHPLLDADAVAWVGAGDQTESDVLVINVGVRDPYGYSTSRFGRFVLSTGAVRPVHLDGVHLRGRAPSGTSLELFGGLPVVPELGERDFDWLAGSRLAQALWEERIDIGLSYLHRRDAGMIADEELGADFALRPLDWLSVSSVAAFDLTHEGLSDARLRLSANEGDVTAALFAERRVAARLLPSTSLFSVISDGAASELGGDLGYRAYPRLDVGGSAALLTRDSGEADLGEDLGYRVALRATLRLDDEGAGRISLEGNRRDVANAAFSGVRLSGERPIGLGLHVHGALELVAADEPGDRGALWPWARLGASYEFADSWQLAAAVQARASPEHEGELDGLARLSYHAGGAPW